MIVACPSCGSQLSVGEELAGHLVSCSQCSESFSVPLTAQAVYVAPPSVSTTRHRPKGGGVGRIASLALMTMLICCGGPIGVALMVGKDGIRRIRAELDDKQEPVHVERGSAATPSVTVPESRTPESTVTAIKLTVDYSANEVAADRRYKGKFLRVTGKVAAVSLAVFGNGIHVVLEGDDKSLRQVQCFLKKSEFERSERLKVGQPASLVGVVDGLLANVQVKDAEIEY